MEWKTLIAVFVYIACGAAGDLLLSAGMRQLGAFPGAHPAGLLRFLLHIVTTPAVIAGTGLLALGFGAFLAMLTWADLSVIVPSGAGSYVLITFLSRWVLHETVPMQRWSGVLLVSIGIALILSSRSPEAPEVTQGLTAHREERAAESALEEATSGAGGSMPRR